MKNDFQTLVEFLGRCEPEVGGRGVATPDREEAARLARFANGKCSVQERNEVCTLLRQNPTWLRWVADVVKQKRPGY